MSVLRPFIMLFLLLALVAGGWAGFFYWNKGFSESWRARIAEELSKENMSADIGKLTLDPFRGLRASGIRLYAGKERTNLLAAINELRLDVDVARLIRGDQFVKSVELDRANLSLPMDPAAPTAKSVRITNFSGKLVVSGDRFEIRKADGDLYGVQFHVSGTLLKPTPVDRPDKAGVRHDRQHQRLEVWREVTRRQPMVSDVIHHLRRLRYDGQKPHLDLQIDGDLDRPADLRVRAVLHSQGVRYSGYTAAELRVEADYWQGEVNFRQIFLRDTMGALRAEMRWRSGVPTVPFTLTSTADLPGLLRTVTPWPLAREAVFYEPVKLEATGNIEWAPGDTRVPPVDALGRLTVGKFATKGTVFSGFSAGFAVRNDAWFLRDAVLSHASGTLTGAAMKKDGEFRYRAAFHMSPEVAAPLLGSESVRREMEATEWSDDTVFQLDAAGGGAAADPAHWSHRGMLSAQNFKYRGLTVKQLDAELEHTPQRSSARKIRVQRPEGTVTTTLIAFNPDDHMLEIRGLASETAPGPMVHVCYPPASSFVDRLRFERPPVVNLDGMIDLTTQGRTRLGLIVQGQGEIGYPLAGRTLPLLDPVVNLDIHPPFISITSSRSKVKPGFEMAGATFRGTPELRMTADFDMETDDGDATRWQLTVSAPGDTDYALGGKALPLAGLRAGFDFRRGRLDMHQCTAGLYGGKITASAEFDGFDAGSGYSAAVEAEHIRFGSLARLYAPDIDTEGEINGGVHITGREGDSGTVRGSGRFKIRDGNIFAIPLLGPLSPLLSAVLPGEKTAYGKAKEATATFLLQDGRFVTKDFEGLTSAFIIYGDGTVDYLGDKVNLTTRITTRGPTGLLLYPVSKLLQFDGRGTLKDPRWRSSVLSLPMKLLQPRDDAERPPREPAAR